MSLTSNTRIVNSVRNMVDSSNVFVNPHLRPPPIGGYSLTDISSGSLDQASKLHTAFWQGVGDATGAQADSAIKGARAAIGPDGFAYIPVPTATTTIDIDLGGAGSNLVEVPDYRYPDRNSILLYDSTDWAPDPVTGARHSDNEGQPTGTANSFTMYHLGTLMAALGDRNHALNFSPQMTVAIVPNSGSVNGPHNIHSSVINFIQHTNVRSGAKTHDDDSHTRTDVNPVFGNELQAYIEYRVPGKYKLTLEKEFIGHQHNIINLLGMGSAHENNQNMGKITSLELYAAGSGNVISFGPNANTVTLDNVSPTAGIYNGAILMIGKDGSQTFDPKEIAKPGARSPDILDAEGNVLQAGKLISDEALAAVRPLSDEFMPSISYDIPLGADGSEYQTFTIIEGPTVEGGRDLVTDPDITDFIEVVAIEADDPDYVVPDYRYDVDWISRITNFNWTQNKLNVNPFVLGCLAPAPYMADQTPPGVWQWSLGRNAFLDGVYTTLDEDNNVVQPIIILEGVYPHTGTSRDYKERFSNAYKLLSSSESQAGRPEAIGAKAFHEAENVWSWSDRYVFGPPQTTHPSISPNGQKVVFSGRYLEYDIIGHGVFPYVYDNHINVPWEGAYDPTLLGSNYYGKPGNRSLPDYTLPEAHLISRLTGEGSKTHWKYEAAGVNAGGYDDDYVTENGAYEDGYTHAKGMTRHMGEVAFRTGLWTMPIHHNTQYQDQNSVLSSELINITRTANTFFPGPRGYNSLTNGYGTSYPNFWGESVDIGRDVYDPEWSPDGNKIIYTNCMFAQYPHDVLLASPKINHIYTNDGRTHRFAGNYPSGLDNEAVGFGGNGSGGPSTTFTPSYNDDDLRWETWGNRCTIIWPNVTEFTCLPDAFADVETSWIPESVHDSYTPEGLRYYRNKLMWYATPSYTRFGMSVRGWKKADMNRPDAGFPGGQFLPQWATPGQASFLWGGDERQSSSRRNRKNLQTAAGTIQVMNNDGTSMVNVIGGNTTINEIATTFKSNVRDDHWFKKYIDSDEYSLVMGKLGDKLLTAFPYCWHPSWASSGDEILFVSNLKAPIDWIPAGVIDPYHNHFALTSTDENMDGFPDTQITHGELAQEFKLKLLALNFSEEDIDRTAMELIMKQYEPIPVIGCRYYMGPGLERAMAIDHRSASLADEGTPWLSEDGFLKFYMGHSPMGAHWQWTNSPSWSSRDKRFRRASQPPGYVGEFYSSYKDFHMSETSATISFDGTFATPGMSIVPTNSGGLGMQLDFDPFAPLDLSERQVLNFGQRSIRPVQDTDYNECPQYYPNDIFIIGCDQTNPEANTPDNMIRLTTESGAYGHPVLSPDETMIAYEKWELGEDGDLEHGKYSQIWIMDFDKTTKISSNHRVVVYRAASFRPRWSSDSTKLLYSTNLNREGLNTIGVIYGGRKAPGRTGGDDEHNTVDKRKAFYPIHNLTSWVLNLSNNTIARLDDKQLPNDDIVQDYSMADWMRTPEGNINIVYQTLSHSDNYSHQNAFELATAVITFHNGPSTLLARDRYRPKLDGVEFRISNADGSAFLATPPASGGEAMLPMWTSVSSETRHMIATHIPAPANATHNSSTTIPVEDYYRRINAAAASSETTVKDEAEKIIGEIYNQGLGHSTDLGWNNVLGDIPPPAIQGLWGILMNRAVYIRDPNIVLIDRGPSLAASLYYLVGTDVTQTNMVSKEVQEISEAKSILSMAESSSSANIMAGITSTNFRVVANLVSGSSL